MVNIILDVTDCVMSCYNFHSLITITVQKYIALALPWFSMTYLAWNVTDDGTVPCNIKRAY